MDNLLLVSSAQMLQRGLRLLGLSARKLHYSTKVRKFKAHFGSHPNQCATVWKDLLTTDIPAARVAPEDADLRGFFGALYFLRLYQSEDVRAARFKMNEKTHRELSWLWVGKIAALKDLKIKWPADEEWDTTFIVSVDGAHFRINEPRDPDCRRHSKWYSHKHNCAGVNHEIAIHLFKQQVVHLKCWDVASKHDKTVFKEELQGKIPAGKRVVVDNGYEGVPEFYSAYNQFDTDEVKEFKKRAKSRHETFNGHMKIFECLDARFRHPDLEKHQLCFDAVGVLCQYAIEDTDPSSANPLFDI